MVAHGVSFGHHTFDQVGAGLNVVSYQEKCGVDIVLFQGVQDGGGIPVFISRVKGQVNHLILRILGIVGIVLFQIIRSGIADGHLSLARET